MRRSTMRRSLRVSRARSVLIFAMVSVFCLGVAFMAQQTASAGEPSTREPSSSAFTANASAVRAGWPVGGTAAIKLHLTSGSARIVGWARDSIHLEGTLGRGESLFGGGNSIGFKFGVEGRSTAGASMLVVHVPMRALFTVRSGAASVAVDSMQGTLDIGVAAGSITVRGSPETLIAETLAGDVHIDGSATVMRLRTSGGAIRVVGGFDQGEMNTVSGLVELTLARVQSLRVSTVSGNVAINSRTAPSRLLTVETFSGDVRTTMPMADVALDAMSDEGLVTLPPEMARRLNDRAGAPVRGARLALHSFRGNIVVNAPLLSRRP